MGKNERTKGVGLVSNGLWTYQVFLQNLLCTSQIPRALRVQQCVGQSTVSRWGGVGKLCAVEYGMSVWRRRQTVWGRVGQLCGVEYDKSVGLSEANVWERVR